MLAAQHDEVLAVEAALGAARQEVAQLLGEPAGLQRLAHAGGPLPRAVLQLAVEQAADLQELLGTGQQARGRLAREDGLTAQQGVGIAVERERERCARGAAHAAGDTLAQLFGGLAAEREHQHPLGVGSTPLDAVDDALDDRGGLAGARAREHEQRAALVAHHRPLALVESRRHRLPRASPPHQTVGLTTHNTLFHQTTRVDRADSTVRCVCRSPPRTTKHVTGGLLRPAGVTRHTAGKAFGGRRTPRPLLPSPTGRGRGPLRPRLALSRDQPRCQHGERTSDDGFTGRATCR